MADVSTATGKDFSHGMVSSRFQGVSHFLKLLPLSIKANGLIWLMIFGYIIYGRWQTSMVEGYMPSSFGLLIAGFFLAALPLFAIAIMVERFIYMAFVIKPEHPIKALALELKSFFCCPQRMANGLPMMVATFLFANQFGQIKDVIPQINPFQWDYSFMALDRALHFGFDPWTLLQPLLGYWPVTVFFDWTYYLWLVVIYSVWVVGAFAKEHSVLRTQFMIAFFLIWAVVGNFMAIALSSAGPVFYGDIGLTPDPFAGLATYLAGVNEIVPLMAVETKKLLWQSYMGASGQIAGISAMPSMHNCSAILVAIYGWQVNRRLGIGLSVFAGLIFIGSIHLGWHYAVDGYVAGLAAVLLWWLSGKLARWSHSTKASRLFQIYKKRNFARS